MTRATDFWSRRKAGVALEAERDEDSRVEAEAAEAQATLEERPDAEILAELGLPDPDLMQQGDDFTAFMDRAVPERLRQRALRRLWRSDPVLANLDGLNNYDTDFRQSDIPGIAVKTGYEVGKGFARTILGADDEAGEPAEQLDLAGAGAEDVHALTAQDPSEDDAATVDAEAQDREAHDDGPQDDGYAPAPRRRMRFEYTG